jgi:hypothetical protein
MVCGICGKAGHNRRSCVKEQPKKDNEGDSYCLEELFREVVEGPIKIIDISRYDKKFEYYHFEVVFFAKEHKIRLPSLETMRGQALALMTQTEVRGQYYLTRKEATIFMGAIGMNTNDAIQQFNKATGFKRVSKKGKYCLEYPYKPDVIDIRKREGLSMSVNKNDFIDRVKNWWRSHLLDVPNEEWQIGHLDPTISDTNESNLAYQPPLQARYRDRFKWDTYFHRMWPTGKELMSNNNMNDYYTVEEQTQLCHFLMEKLKISSHP